MTGTKATRRPGFTLIELLVVISIIGVIAALAGVALFGTSESQRRNSVDQQIDKLQKALDAEYGTVLSKATAETNTIPPAVVTYADGIPRAKCFWAAANLRRNFPDTFAEAGAPVAVVPGFQLAVLTPFNGLASAGSAHEESAALMYIILTQKSASGGGSTAGSGDELGATRDVTLNGRPFKVFVDSWGNSIGFRRWETGSEAVSRAVPGVGNNLDPLDTSNLVFGWADSAKRSWASGVTPPAPACDLFRNWGGGRPMNRMVSVYSPGKDKAVGTADDQLGIRLKQLGAKGKQ
jgi:prepilin-type N-terminal cleavage/methylation domain-containing protein